MINFAELKGMPLNSYINNVYNSQIKPLYILKITRFVILFLLLVFVAGFAFYYFSKVETLYFDFSNILFLAFLFFLAIFYPLSFRISSFLFNKINTNIQKLISAYTGYFSVVAPKINAHRLIKRKLKIRDCYFSSTEVPFKASYYDGDINFSVYKVDLYKSVRRGKNSHSVVHVFSGFIYKLNTIKEISMQSNQVINSDMKFLTSFNDLKTASTYVLVESDLSIFDVSSLKYDDVVVYAEDVIYALSKIEEGGIIISQNGVKNN